MKQKLTKLEAVRGLAASYVVLCHSFFNKSIIFHFGQEAVILFFILSGFVIHLAYARSKDKSFKLFFTKRFLRIYIPLVCVFICDYFLEVYEQHRWVDINEKNLMGNFLMLQDRANALPNGIARVFMGNSPLWSLSYEWWFYMIFFFVTTKLKRKASTFVYITGFLSSIAYMFFPEFPLRILMYLVIWWSGGEMANLYLNDKPISLNNLKRPVLTISGIIIILFLNLYLDTYFSDVTIHKSPLLELRHFSFTLVAIFCAFLWKEARWIGFNKTIGLFEPVSTVSYGIYISHFFLVTKAAYLNMISNEYVRFFCYCLVCLLFSYLLERVIYIRVNKIIMAKLHYWLSPKQKIKSLEGTVN